MSNAEGVGKAYYKKRIDGKKITLRTGDRKYLLVEAPELSPKTEPGVILPIIVQGIAAKGERVTRVGKISTVEVLTQQTVKRGIAPAMETDFLSHAGIAELSVMGTSTLAMRALGSVDATPGELEVVASSKGKSRKELLESLRQQKRALEAQQGCCQLIREIGRRP